MKNDNGQPTKPRDLARGIFKGGGEPNRLYCRIALGIPGTPMPASNAALKPPEIGDLVNFVLSLSANANQPPPQQSARR
jgi:mono/diheme cytochrome c family protein